ncbi:hypothetical protein DFH08DRAFT_816136 [Mycena albidolilacea]|uniref:Uncharacterized protein n=1 Tax=Mycena albidolilacea TaxID=1033008 RepID=A0AAD6ZL25_9AGAR|nr:hypothetical protein DFH08DRAFT_816136 [Mycena albidolilacea]
MTNRTGGTIGWEEWIEERNAPSLLPLSPVSTSKKNPTLLDLGKPSTAQRRSMCSLENLRKGYLPRNFGMVFDFGFIVDEVDAETRDQENFQFLMALSTPKPILPSDDSTVPNRSFGPDFSLGLHHEDGVLLHSSQLVFASSVKDLFVYVRPALSRSSLLCMLTSTPASPALGSISLVHRQSGCLAADQHTSSDFALGLPPLAPRRSPPSYENLRIYGAAGYMSATTIPCTSFAHSVLNHAPLTFSYGFPFTGAGKHLQILRVDEKNGSGTHPLPFPRYSPVLASLLAGESVTPPHQDQPDQML